MRVAFIIYGKADKRSGGFLYDWYFLNSLKSSGHTVQVFSQKEGNFPAKIFENTLKKFRNLINFNPDIIIEDELNHASLFIINRKLKSLTGAPVITVVHHLRSEEKLNLIFKHIIRGIEYKFLKSCDAYIFNSVSTKKSVESLLQQEVENSIVVYPGKNNLPLKERKKRKKDPINFLFAGNIIPRKNPDLVLKALKKISGKGWKLNICGEGSAESRYFEDLKLSACNLEIAGQVKFFGRVDDDKLSSMISESDFLIVPSDWEGFGIIYLEAMRAGVIPIASKHGGAGEIIDEGINGFLIPTEDDIYLENLLRNILNKNVSISEMREKCIKKAMSFFPWDETMENAVKYIENIQKK